MSDHSYSPQVINDQDTQMGGQEEQSNGHGGTPQASTTSPVPEDSNSRYNSPSLYQQPGSRPGSGMGGMQPQQYQDQRQAQPNKSSVVIKVGMVGDAQIGKTSLMVKYVEGSWDEDYIQTLGKNAGSLLLDRHVLTTCRRQFHGKDHLNP